MFASDLEVARQLAAVEGVPTLPQEVFERLRLLGCEMTNPLPQAIITAGSKYVW